MDDALIARWRSGEANAKVAVRNRIRGIAERLLSQPDLLGALRPSASLRNDRARRELTADIAREVMKRRADSATQLTALSLMIAGRHAVEALQEGRLSTGEAHLPPAMAVSMALTPSTLGAGPRAAADRHLATCTACSKDIQLLERAVRNHAAAVPDEAPETISAAAAHMSSGERESAIAATMREAVQRPDPWPATVQRRQRAASRSRRPAPKRSSADLVRWALIAIIVAIVVVMVMRPRGELVTLGAVSGLSELADRSPPTVRERSSPEMGYVAADLADGQCANAAGRLRAQRSQHPAQLDLYVLEGACLICAGDGRKALRVFSELDAQLGEDQTAPTELAWYRAQALLLTDEADLALAALESAARRDMAHSSQAEAQISAIKEKAR